MSKQKNKPTFAAKFKPGENVQVRHGVSDTDYPDRPEHGHAEQIKVIGLGDPAEEPVLDEDYGIICEARFERRVINAPLDELERVKDKTNRQLIDDFLYWFHNWR